LFTFRLLTLCSLFFFFSCTFCGLCVCKRNRPVFVDFSMFNQTGVHHIFKTYSVFSVVDVFWEWIKLDHLLKECGFHLTKEIIYIFFFTVILILRRERESHSQLLVLLWFDLNHTAPAYKVGALQHEPDSPFWGYLLRTFFMKFIFGFDVYWWVLYYIQSGVV
jgi:hypothetical protein